MLMYLVVLLLLVALSTSNMGSSCVDCVDSNSLAVLRLSMLNKIQHSILKKCHYFPMHSRDDLFGGKLDKAVGDLSSIINNQPVHLYSPCMSTYNLGNSLGNYFAELFCSIDADVNFVIGTTVWDHPHMPFEYKGKSGSAAKKPEMERYHIAFFDQLPTEAAVTSPHAYTLTSVNRSDVAIEVFRPHLLNEHTTDKDKRKQLTLERIKHTCSCDKYCWQHADAAWTRHHNDIRSIMNHAIDAHLASNETNSHQGTLIGPHDVSNTSDNKAPTSPLPLIPTVAIHYRCGDTVPSDVYGFLAFAAVVNLIPENASSIFILTDPAVRASVIGNAPPFAANCVPITQALFDFVSTARPAAAVVLKRGGDPFVDYARLARAQVTICSASTFCLWPALASETRVHFPVTVIAGGWEPHTHMLTSATKPATPRDSLTTQLQLTAALAARHAALDHVDDASDKDSTLMNVNSSIPRSNSSSTATKRARMLTTSQISLPPYFGPYFHWIVDPLIIIEFKEHTPLQTVLAVLRGSVPRDAINKQTTASSAQNPRKPSH